MIKPRQGGANYIVEVLHVTDGVFPVTIFGAENEDKARSDALSSFMGHDRELVSVLTIRKIT
jgi:hypothetical protein